MAIFLKFSPYTKVYSFDIVFLYAIIYNTICYLLSLHVLKHDTHDFSKSFKLLQPINMPQPMNLKVYLIAAIDILLRMISIQSIIRNIVKQCMFRMSTFSVCPQSTIMIQTYQSFLLVRELLCNILIDIVNIH